MQCIQLSALKVQTYVISIIHFLTLLHALMLLVNSPQLHTEIDMEITTNIQHMIGKIFEIQHS
jgi:hypothetical protein